MTPNQQIGAAIRAVRTSRGLSLSKLGKLINRSPKTISAYEHGRITIPATILLDLAEAMGVSINRLLPTRNKNATAKK